MGDPHKLSGAEKSEESGHIASLLVQVCRSHWSKSHRSDLGCHHWSGSKERLEHEFRIARKPQLILDATASAHADRHTRRQQLMHARRHHIGLEAGQLAGWAEAQKAEELH